MIRASTRVIGAVAIAACTLSCGEVPTLQDGVAYITPVQLPLPAVAAGDTLRDSLGRATPLRVQAFDRDGQEITGLATTFLPTSLPSVVTIDASGYVVARDTVGTVQIVGRVGDRLQTTPTTLLVVPAPVSISRVAGDELGDTLLALPALRALPVRVAGIFRGAATGVDGILVRYRIDSLRPAGPTGRAILLNASGFPLRPDSTIAVDTTKSGGTATRSVLVQAGAGVDTVFVSASARRLRDGGPLDGSPVRFIVAVRRQP
jgi:hypothetical protein